MMDGNDFFLLENFCLHPLGDNPNAVVSGLQNQKTALQQHPEFPSQQPLLIAPITQIKNKDTHQRCEQMLNYCFENHWLQEHVAHCHYHFFIDDRTLNPEKILQSFKQRFGITQTSGLSYSTQRCAIFPILLGLLQNLTRPKLITIALDSLLNKNHMVNFYGQQANQPELAMLSEACCVSVFSQQTHAASVAIKFSRQQEASEQPQQLFFTPSAQSMVIKQQIEQQQKYFPKAKMLQNPYLSLGALGVAGLPMQWILATEFIQQGQRNVVVDFSALDTLMTMWLLG